MTTTIPAAKPASYRAPKYPTSLNQRVTGGYGNGQIGTTTYFVNDRVLVTWKDSTSTWQARWTLRTA